ncbi:MAG TPA: MFS transporter [Candidatus Limnocylindrales bacterium]|nr:MFS transporter [Candidatus Limnocylindrales bacterium]
MTNGTVEPTDDRPSGRRRLGGLLVDPAPLRLDRDFRLLWIGQGISTLGRTFTLVAIPYQVYVLTGDLLAVGALSIVQLVATLIFALGGGAVADAVDRRRLLLLTQLGQAGCSLAFLAIALSAAPSLLAIYAVVFVSSALGSIDGPARAAAIPRLVPPERLHAAIGLNQLVFNAAWVIGPAIGGIILATFGVAAAYAIDVVTFASVIVALLLISPIPPAVDAVRPSVAAVAEGLRFARRRREVLATFIVDINAMVFGSPTSLFPALALDVFMVGPAGVGLMWSAVGFGAMLGALFSGWTTTVRRPGRAVLIAVAVWGLGITGFGLATFSFPLALGFLALAAGADVVSAVLRSGIVQLLTPDSLRGRVSSIHLLVVTSGPEIGNAEASLVASVIGTQAAVVSGGLLTLAGLGVIALAMPEFSRLDMRSAIAAAHGATPAQG